MRTSSLVCWSSSIGNGGVFALFKIVMSEIITSTPPVTIFGFTASGARAMTSPVTSITYSLRHLSAIAHASLDTAGLNTTWTNPSLSRKSIKITPPKSRRF